jgi:hypothetical protein
MARRMKRRVGMTYRLHDVGPFTFGIDPNGRAGTYCPRVFFIWRRTGWFAPLARRRNPRVKLYTRVQFYAPHVSWRAYWRLRRVPGMLALYKLDYRFWRWIGS